MYNLVMGEVRKQTGFGGRVMPAEVYAVGEKRSYLCGRPRKGVKYDSMGRVVWRGRNRGGGSKKLEFGGYWLTLRQKRFVDLVCDEGGGYFLDFAGAYMEAYGLGDRGKAGGRVNDLMKKNNDVMPAIKDRLMREENLEVIESRVAHILRDGSVAEFQRMYDLFMKTVGGYAPEKTANVNYNIEERERELEEIKGLIPEMDV